MEDIQRGKREASPVAGCSSQPIKKPKPDIQFHLNGKILESADTIKDFWLADGITHGIQSFCDGDVSILKAPFRSCHALNFINDEVGKTSNLENLLEELKQVTLKQKSSDLFHFKQSLDLVSCSDDLPVVDALRTFLLTKVKPWLMTITGITDLSDKIDMFCAKYSHGDYLLCHDDQLEGRRIAYILYLVDETWTEEDGGALDLFSSEDGVPTQVAHSFMPKFNSFAFFPVSKRSFHQVSEVITRSRDRLSITGWFYGETLPTEPINVRNDLLTSWINPKYFKPMIQKQIKAKFTSRSNISLDSFLNPEKYSKVLEALSSLNKSWMKVGPPNERNYHRLELDPDEIDGPEIKIIGECLSIFKSYEFLNLLGNITGIDAFVDDTNDDEVNGLKKPSPDANRNPEKEKISKEVVNMDDDEVVCLDDDVEDDNEVTCLSDDDVKDDNEVTCLTDDDVEDENEVTCLTDDNDDQDEVVYLSDDDDEPPSLKMQPEVRRWTAGDYTVLLDKNFHERTTLSLDVNMFFMDESPWDQNWGGSTNYVAKGESNQLLSISPVSNTISLVCNEPQVEPFVKYINKSSSPNSFYDFFLSIDFSN